MRTLPLAAALVFSCGPQLAEVVDDDELAADVPAELAAARLRSLGVASWNVQWFGSTANGPSDEPLQAANVRAAIDAAGLDLWGMSEVVSPAQFDALVAGLPGHRALLATEVKEGPSYYSSNEQKVGLVWRESAAALLSARLVATASAYDFGGRPPLEVSLQLASGEPLTVLVLHMKAFGDADSFARRQRAAAALQTHLDTELAGQAFAVIGDWNDDVGAFASLATAHRFTTAPLSAAGEKSTVNGRRMIDHHLASLEFSGRLLPQSPSVLHPAIADYGTTTSDHYPVVTRYALGPAVRISQVLANEPGRDRGLERIALRNAGDARVDLGGWTLSDAQQERHRFPAGTALGPGATLDVTGGEASSGSLSLNNPADAAVLRDAAGALVDQLAWSSPQADGEALETR